MIEIVLLFGSYILGSIPFGLIIAKTWCGVDIRKYGSGNIGATNVLRSIGRGPAIVVFLADVLKGLIPVWVAKSVFPESAWIPVVCGLVSILGHSLSIFLRFKGGKGVATSLGVIVGLDPRVAGIAFALWIIVVTATRYVSVASMVAAVGVPALMFAFGLPVPFKAFGLLAGAFVIVKHRSNMVRLAQGKEPRWGERVNTSGG